MEREYTVLEIRGDYAILRSDTGIEDQVALAFLPPEVSDGDRVATNGFEFRIVG